MPNFGNVGRELAKEINEEPEEEVETGGKNIGTPIIDTYRGSFGSNESRDFY